MSDLILEGVNLMVVGITTVFGFLVLLIFAITVMSKVINTFFPEKPRLPQPQSPAPGSNEPPKDTDGQLIAVISAAIQKYRAHRK
ncbi:MAG: hypothetical protein COB04_06450 [Gammaproteobacteria bacterium]|nr:MAG: hypothetical protein COB04_06450 [Gammaproteobacteria bacterium]